MTTMTSPTAGCKWCGLSLTEKQTAKHEAHCPDRPDGVKCRFCGKTYDDYRSLNGHMNAHPERLNTQSA